MAMTQTGKETAKQGDLFMSFELGEKLWKLSCSDANHGPSRYTVNAGDKDAIRDCIHKAKTRFGLDPRALVHSCFYGDWFVKDLMAARARETVVVRPTIREVGHCIEFEPNARTSFYPCETLQPRTTCSMRAMRAGSVRLPTRPIYGNGSCAVTHSCVGRVDLLS